MDGLVCVRFFIPKWSVETNFRINIAEKPDIRKAILYIG